MPRPPRRRQLAPRAQPRTLLCIAPWLTLLASPHPQSQAIGVRAVRNARGCAVVLRSAATDSIIESMKKLTVRQRPISAEPARPGSL